MGRLKEGEMKGKLEGEKLKSIEIAKNLHKYRNHSFEN